MRAIDRDPPSGATVRIVRHGNDTTAGRELVVAPAGTPAPVSAEFADEQLTATTATWLDADSIRMRTRYAEKCDGDRASHEVRFLHTRLGCPPIERSRAIRERQVGIARPPRDRCFAHRTLATQRQIVRNCGAPTLYISERRAPNPTNESVVQNSNLVP